MYDRLLACNLYLIKVQVSKKQNYAINYLTKILPI